MAIAGVENLWLTVSPNYAMQNARYGAGGITADCATMAQPSLQKSGTTSDRW